MAYPENPAEKAEEFLSSEEVMKRFVAERGDIFEEFHFVAKALPRTMNHMRVTAGYVHFYEGQTTATQELSGPMRELIALCQLCAKGDGRFAPNHVRRLYRMGITNAAMFEAAESIAPVVGWSTISHVAQAILTANDPGYPYGELPAGGEPARLEPFAEMSKGRGTGDRGEADSLLNTPEWQYVAKLDAELARRASAFVDHCLLPSGAGSELLGPGPRELVAIAALCARGEAEIAATHIARAYELGLNEHQVLEAISCVLPMTGAVTVQVGVRAMWLCAKRLASAKASATAVDPMAGVAVDKKETR